MIVHGIWASSVMVGDAGGEGVKPSVNFHGDRCGAVWCNGLDVGCLVVWSSVLIVLPAKIIFFVGIIEGVFSEQFLSYVSVDGIACVVAVGGGVLDMIVGRDDEFECQAKRKSQHWANYDAGADADAPSCSLVFFVLLYDLYIGVYAAIIASQTSFRCGCSLDLLVNENEKKDAREGHRPPEKRKRRNLHVLVFLDVVMSMCCRGASYFSQSY